MPPFLAKMEHIICWLMSCLPNRNKKMSQEHFCRSCPQDITCHTLAHRQTKVIVIWSGFKIITKWTLFQIPTSPFLFMWLMILCLWRWWWYVQGQDLPNSYWCFDCLGQSPWALFLWALLLRTILLLTMRKPGSFMGVQWRNHVPSLYPQVSYHMEWSMESEK